MKRSRVILAVATLVIVGVGAWLVVPRSSAICRANYERIREGMTLNEVEDILGGPARDESTGNVVAASNGSIVPCCPATADEWKSDSCIIWVHPDRDRRVRSKASLAVYPSDGVLRRLRRWLKL